MNAVQLVAIQISMPSDAAQRIIFSRSLVTGPHHQITPNSENTGKKQKRNDVLMDDLRLKILTSDAV